MVNFTHFTDPVLMRDLLQQHLPICTQGQLRISQCQVLHSQYYANVRHPLRSWLGICYEVSFVDSIHCRCEPQILYGRARLGGQSRHEFDQAQEATLWPSRWGEPVVHLPRLDMTIWSFPNDPQLPQLPQVINPALVRAHFPYAVLPAGFTDPTALRQVEVAVVHYYPEERCTTRYQLASSEPEQPEALTLFGKTFQDQTGSMLFARLNALWQRAQAEPDLFGVTQPLAYDATIQTIWLKFQPGRPLVEVIDPTNAERLLTTVAHGLVALQQGDFPHLHQFTYTGRLAEIRDKAKKLVHALPTWQELLDNLLEQLTSAAANFASAPTTLLHGDFHPRQFLVDDDKIICCDFDELAQGDPLQDVASFLVDLQLGDFAPPLQQQMAQSFYRAYCQAAPWDASLPRLIWQLRYQFFTKAYRAYRQQRPGWKQRAQTMLAMAQEVQVTDLL